MYDELAENVHVIQTTDTCDLVLTADYNTKITKTEKKILDHDHDIYIYIYIYIYKFTSECHKQTTPSSE